jgi:hypothetical protein
MATLRRVRALELIFLAAVVFAPSCVMQTDPGAPDDESVAASSAALAALFTQYTWTQGDPTLDLAPLDTHFCTLTAVGGTFRGPGEEVRVYANAIRGVWEFHGKSNMTGVGGQATCYRRDAFTGAGSNVVRRASPEFSLRMHHAGSCFFCAGEVDPVLIGPGTWAGDSVIMLTGISGDFRGTMETVFAAQGLTANDANHLSVHTDVADDDVIAYAHNFFVGSESYSGRAALFYAPTDQLVTAQDIHATSIVSSRGTLQTKRLAVASRAFCFLGTISGSLSGPQEGARIEPRDGIWQLEVQAASGHELIAYARCLALDQSGITRMIFGNDAD